ncbi:MAG: NAD-dependent epimerase/dehydratase family protein [Clostridium sp.]
MKKYLLTGATGFLGSNLTRALLMEGHEVHIIVKPSSNNIWRIKDIKDKLILHPLDLTDFKGIITLINKGNFNVIVNMATYGGFHYEEAEEAIINTNLLSTWNIVSSLKNSNIDMFINTGSSSEYGEKLTQMSEEMALNPNNLYGASKASSTLLCSSYAKINKIPMCTLRLFSPYGFFDSPSRLIPTVIINTLKDKSIYISSPNGERDFIFINDVIDAYKKAELLKNTYGEVFNIGYGASHKVFEIIEEINKLLPLRSKVIYKNNKSRQYEPIKWEADVSKSYSKLLWTPKTSLSLGLEKTITWFINNLNYY